MAGNALTQLSRREVTECSPAPSDHPKDRRRHQLGAGIQGGSDWRVRGASAFCARASGTGHRRVAELGKLMIPAGPGW
eukprot:gene8891-biopygen11